MSATNEQSLPQATSLHGQLEAMQLQEYTPEQIAQGQMVFLSRDVIMAVIAERVRQERKWGEQNHPSLDQTLLNRPGGCTPGRMCEEFQIPSPTRATFLCDMNHRRGTGTWAHILVEEVAEVVGEFDPIKRRQELIQTAAVCLAWIASIDRNEIAQEGGAAK